MARTITITFEDGTTHTYQNAPDSVTPQEVKSRAEKEFGKSVKGLDGGRKPQADDTIDPTADMSGLQKFGAGMGKAFVDIAKGAGQNVGMVSREEVAADRERDAPLMQTGAGMAGNLVGNLAAAIPAAFIPGANTVLGGSLLGAGMGLLQPSTSTGETLKNVGVGAIAAPAVNALTYGGKVLKSLVEPFYESGRSQIIGRALRNSAGNQADEALRNLQTVRSGVPGVEYTAGEAAKNPGIAAMQRTATAIDPVAMNESVARQAANNTARVEQLGKMAGSDGRLATALQDRGNLADVAYKTARQSDAMRRQLAQDAAIAQNQARVGMGSLGNVPKISDATAAANAIRPTKTLEDLAKRPSMQRVIESAKKLAADKGEDIGDPLTSIDGLHYIKLALDDALEFNPVNALGRNEKSALMSIKTSLVDEMDKISPVYGAARENFAKLSKPINEMEVIGEIADKATKKLDGTLLPNSYANALTDGTAARVTGMPNASLSSVIEPQNLQMLNAIRDDLAAQNFLQTAGRGVGSDTVQKLAFSNMLDQAGVPTFMRNFGPTGIVGNLLQRGGQVAYSDANKAMAEKLARALLNPQETAELMAAGQANPQMAALIDALKRSGVAIGGGTTGAITANQQP